MIQYSFKLSDYRTLLSGLARKLGLQVRNKQIDIPARLGKGYAFASNISGDLSFAILNFTLLDDIKFNRKKSDPYGMVLAFNQIENSDVIRFTEGDTRVTDHNARLRHIYLSSADANLEIGISKNSPTKIVVVFFSPHLVRRAVKKDILVNLMMYSEKGLENMYHEPITFEYQQILDDIFETNTSSPISNLVLQNRILLLTEKFLAAFLEKKDAPEGKDIDAPVKPRDLEALREVEALLRQKDLDNFPSIAVLSRTAKMSSTKLKKKFKRVYGMRLYEYYNRNRLEKAREMLQTGQHSVKEVGLEIGFSNLSNFAKAFKKEFGVLPNELLKAK